MQMIFKTPFSTDAWLPLHMKCYSLSTGQQQSASKVWPQSGTLIGADNWLYWSGTRVVAQYSLDQIFAGLWAQHASHCTKMWRVLLFFCCGPLRIKKILSSPTPLCNGGMLSPFHKVLRLSRRSGQILNSRIEGDIQELASAKDLSWKVPHFPLQIFLSQFPPPQSTHRTHDSVTKNTELRDPGSVALDLLSSEFCAFAFLSGFSKGLRCCLSVQLGGNRLAKFLCFSFLWSPSLWYKDWSNDIQSSSESFKINNQSNHKIMS